jgi:predicted nucleic acid-binding protein
LRLVVDTNVAVTEALRTTGRQRLQHSALELFASAEVMNETAHELRRRLESIVARGHLLALPATVLLAVAETTVANSVTSVSRHAYADHLHEATWRIPRDPDDTPTVALALALDCGIWTGDRGFFGRGLPVWSTDMLQAHLESMQGSTAS